VIQESPSPKRIDLPDMNEIQISSPKSKIIIKFILLDFVLDWRHLIIK